MNPTGSGAVTVMGVLNVTADSFSDGGRYLDADAAVEHGLELMRQGADIVDVGGESTRPGASRVDPATEASRVVPVIEALAAEGVTVSIDTMRATVAEAALRAGAAIVNDVTGGRADAAMARVVADAGVPWILMHWRSADWNHSGSANDYHDVVVDVRRELLEQVDAAVDAGVSETSLILDPGLGFAKTGEHNWQLLHDLPQLTATGFPILVGASRKRFLGTLLGDDGTTPRPTAGRDGATAAVSVLSALHGAWGVRVHDVQGTVDALAVVDAWTTGKGDR